MVLALLGCFILAFGWFGFNPGSTLGAAGNGNLRIGIIAVNTMLSGAWGSVAAMVYTWVSGAKKPDIGMMGNGLLAGLVAITAPSGYVSPLFACIIGVIAGVNVVFFAAYRGGSIHVRERRLNFLIVLSLWRTVPFGDNVSERHFVLFHLFHHCLAEFRHISPFIRHVSYNFPELFPYRAPFQEH